MDIRPDTSPDISSLDTYTLTEAAGHLRLSTKTLRRWIKAGKIRATKQPGEKGLEWRFSRDEIHQVAEDRDATVGESDIVRATMDTQLESLSVKVSSLMEQWIDKWADSVQEIVRCVQGGQQEQTEALGELTRSIREIGQQQERIQSLERRIEELEHRPQPWWRLWDRRKGRK